MNTAPAVVAADDKSTLEAVVAQSLKLARARARAMRKSARACKPDFP